MLPKRFSLITPVIITPEFIDVLEEKLEF